MKASLLLAFLMAMASMSPASAQEKCTDATFKTASAKVLVLVGKKAVASGDPVNGALSVLVSLDYWESLTDTDRRKFLGDAACAVTSPKRAAARVQFISMETDEVLAVVDHGKLELK